MFVNNTCIRKCTCMLKFRSYSKADTCIQKLGGVFTDEEIVDDY